MIWVYQKAQLPQDKLKIKQTGKTLHLSLLRCHGLPKGAAVGGKGQWWLKALLALLRRRSRRKEYSRMFSCCDRTDWMHHLSSGAVAQESQLIPFFILTSVLKDHSFIFQTAEERCLRGSCSVSGCFSNPPWLSIGQKSLKHSEWIVFSATQKTTIKFLYSFIDVYYSRTCL